MAEHHGQVFYAQSPARWKRFLWTVRLIVAFLVIAAAVIIAAVLRPDPVGLPRLISQNEVYKKVLDPDHPAMARTKASQAFQEVRRRTGNHASFNYARRLKIPASSVTLPAGALRAAFYVNWDPEAFFSLRDNIANLSLVFPEWFFVPDSADTVVVSIDARALDLLREKKVPVVPMITNYFNERWNGANVHRIITSPARRHTFIRSVLAALQRYRLQGVNVDFEALVETTDEHIAAFQRELYDTLHPAGFLVTMDVAPMNTDYNLQELSRYNDYLVLMAYDQHYAESVPGPVADQRWFESVLDDTERRVPSSQLIIALAAYGYDWPEGGKGSVVTYNEALVTAKESEGTVVFDTAGYNLGYTYADDDDLPHTVFFTDAATTFNQMRAGADREVAGYALWRLGSEDPRIWQFYRDSLGDAAQRLRPFDINLLSIAPAKTDIDFVGEGEILNMVATPDSGRVALEVDTAQAVIDDEHYVSLPSSYVIRKYGQSEKTVALTFDDGPDERYTPALLDILEQEHVPAAFFVVGINVENNVRLLKRIYDDGFEIGNHTFTHPNLAEVNAERTHIELNATRRIIESITGHSTVLFRPPYNADSEPESIEEILPVEVSRADNYYTVAEAIDPQDWNEGISPDTILARIIRDRALGNIVLLHDAGGDRSATVEALPRIIRYYRDEGYTFVPVSALMGKTRDEVMPAVAGGNEAYLLKVNWAVVEGIYWAEHILFALFLIGIILSVGRTLITALLAAFQRTFRSGLPPVPAIRPAVSVIVPAFNEEVNVVRTVSSLLAGSYADLDVVVVDDGSTDNTAGAIRSAFGEQPRVQLFTRPNGGKARALNAGIARARGEIVVCIDADTQLRPDAIEHLLALFDPEGSVAAVAGNAKVGNERNILTRWQAIEYITSQNFDRRAFDLLNAIAVVPGAIGAFRKSALEDVGGFASDTLAEDCDLTLRLLRAGYVVRYAPSAVALTEAPESIKGFLRQRFRWSFGIMQSLWKHRALLFSREHWNLGMVALPNILVFQILLPLLSPLADLVMVVALLSGNVPEVMVYYGVFLVIDALGALAAFSFERENPRRLWLLLLQRFVYRQLMYWVLVKSVVRAIKGELTHWGVLKRTGTVRLEHAGK